MSRWQKIGVLASFLWLIGLPIYLRIPTKYTIKGPVHKKSCRDAVSIISRKGAIITLIVACMLSGAGQDRPVIVGWSSAPRGQVIKESLGQLPKKLAAGPRVLARTESSRTQSRTKQGGPPHDHWAKLEQLRNTRSQYPFVVIALFSIKFIAPPSRPPQLDMVLPDPGGPTNSRRRLGVFPVLPQPVTLALLTKHILNRGSAAARSAPP